MNTATHWAFDAFIYHIYPLGFCNAPANNDLSSAPVPRLEEVHRWIPHIRELGATVVYLGPLFESSTHGYDTADYYRVDRRLGTNETLKSLVAAFHAAGIRVILDGVFNHVGREFFAFRDLRQNGQGSKYCGWFHGLNFQKRNQCGDPFSYDTWHGHCSLVKLNHQNPEVKRHLLGAVESWIKEFDIDGLRLDAADCIPPDFLRELTAFCRARKPDFWQVGEVVMGDYRTWAGEGILDSVTNYECYKGLHSSHNTKNYFEIAHALERQFGDKGVYRHLPLYSFVDNHDVNRIASVLKRTAHLYPLYALLFTMPGVPSVYYGSEWGIEGAKRGGWDDRPMRPWIDLDAMRADPKRRDVFTAVSRFARLRKDSPSLRYGAYRTLHIAAEQLAFLRQFEGEIAIVAVNAADKPATIEFALPAGGGSFVDVLNDDAPFTATGGKLRLELPPCWARILKVRG